jgi:hypothetical protein
MPHEFIMTVIAVLAIILILLVIVYRFRLTCCTVCQSVSCSCSSSTNTCTITSANAQKVSGLSMQSFATTKKKPSSTRRLPFPPVRYPPPKTSPPKKTTGTHTKTATKTATGTKTATQTKTQTQTQTSVDPLLDTGTANFGEFSFNTPNVNTPPIPPPLSSSNQATVLTYKNKLSHEHPVRYIVKLKHGITSKVQNVQHHRDGLRNRLCLKNKTSSHTWEHALEGFSMELTGAQAKELSLAPTIDLIEEDYEVRDKQSLITVIKSPAF